MTRWRTVSRSGLALTNFQMAARFSNSPNAVQGRTKRPRTALRGGFRRCSTRRGPFAPNNRPRVEPRSGSVSQPTVASSAAIDGSQTNCMKRSVNSQPTPVAITLGEMLTLLGFPAPQRSQMFRKMLPGWPHSRHSEDSLPIRRRYCPASRLASPRAALSLAAGARIARRHLEKCDSFCLDPLCNRKRANTAVPLKKRCDTRDKNGSRKDALMSQATKTIAHACRFGNLWKMNQILEHPPSVCSAWKKRGQPAFPTSPVGWVLDHLLFSWLQAEKGGSRTQPTGLNLVGPLGDARNASDHQRAGAFHASDLYLR